jgi:hypothetical protein
MSGAFERYGRCWFLVRGVDPERDGAYLDLWDSTVKPGGELVSLAFHADRAGEITIDRYQENLPPDLVAWFSEKARQLLPRISG